MPDEKAKYDAIAQDYHAFVEADFSTLSVMGLAVGALLERLGAVSGKTICDIGCGEGKLANFIASQGAQITGIDISPALLKIARENYPTVTFIEDDAQTLNSVSDANYDIAISNLALMDIPDLQATIVAVRRILRDDGRFIFTLTHPCFQSPHAENMQQDEKFTGRWVKQYASECHWKSTYSQGIRGKVGAHHRTLSTYINALITHRFHITHIAEPTIPPDEYESPYLQGLAEIPPVMLIEAQAH